MNSRAANAARTVVLVGLGLTACADRHGRPRERDERLDSGIADAAATVAPRIDAERLLLVIEGESVHVIGERGAVSPGGIEVEAQWPVTGELTSGDVAEDGSFDVPVTGWIGERYRVQAVRRSPLARSEPVFVERMQGIDAPAAEGAVPGRDGGALSCDDRSLELSRELSGFGIGGRCQRDADCSLILHEGCGWGGCYAGATSHDALPVAEAGIAAVRDSLCADYTRAGCLAPNQPFVEGCDQISAEAQCVDGRCIACTHERSCGECSPLTCESLDRCEQCPFSEIHWGPIGVQPASGHSVRDCRTFVSVAEDGATCETKFDCIGRGFGASWYNASSLIERLRLPDIQAALRRHAFFGARTADAIGVQLTADTGSISVSTARCDGAPGCEEPPQQVTYLRDLLNGIVIQETERCR